MLSVLVKQTGFFVFSKHYLFKENYFLNVNFSAFLFFKLYWFLDKSIFILNNSSLSKKITFATLWRHIFYGTENRKYPDTYFEELNYQCSRVLPLLSLVTCFMWISYIPLDKELHPEAPQIIYFRIGLSIVSSIIFGLYWIPFFRKNSIYLMTVLGSYAVISAGIITGFSGADASYMGGYNILLMGSLFVPVRLTTYYIVMLSSVTSLFVTLIFLDINIVQDVPAYSLNDLISAFILAMVFAFLFDRDRYSYYTKSKEREEQRKQIEQQANVIGEKNTELIAQDQNIKKSATRLQKANKNITASINYAKRIQTAILPEDDEIEELFPKSFIYFKPKDIVSGDFYFLAQQNNKIIIAIADCTGHGIPGAFMSLIGQNLLTEIVQTRRMTAPNLILDELKEGINNRLKQEQNHNQDGMDISICSIQKNEDRTYQVEFAGANNPLVYIKDGELHRLRGDKIMIGGYWRARKSKYFTKQTVQIDSPTHIYLFSDGYQDQFGGKENRKFTSKRLRNLLFEIHKQDMKYQKKIIESTMTEWKGNRNQIDDMVMIGIYLEPTADEEDTEFDEEEYDKYMELE